MSISKLELGKLYCAKIAWGMDKYNIYKHSLIVPISIKVIHINFVTITWLTQNNLCVTDTWNKKLCFEPAWYDAHVYPTD